MPIRRTLPFAWPLLCLFFAAVSAMAASHLDSPFIVDSWNDENGLPDNEANTVLQAKDGYLWIGTDHGLVRFDGNEFSVFDEMNTPALKSDVIVFLYEDKVTNLWIGTQSAGLAVIEKGQIKSFNSETAGAGVVMSAHEDPSDILFYSENGIARYENGKMSFFRNIYSPQLFLLMEHLLVPSRSGEVWQLWTGNVQKWKNNRFEKSFGPCPWGNAPVKAACEDADGSLVVGTFGNGVFWLQSDGTWRHISHDDGLSSDLVLSLCFDDEGNLWVGTDGAGLNRVKRKTFSCPKNFHPWAVQSVSEDGSDGFWAAITSAGAASWQSNVTRVFPVGQSGEAWSILEDHRQQVWAGTRPNGLFLFQTNHFAPAPGARILGSEIFALFQSRDGRLWAGTGNGLGRWDGQNWKIFTIRDGLSDNAINAIAEDAAGNLWLGTENNGLNYFNGERVISYQTTTNGLPGNDISCLYADSDGVLWVGTAGHGLARFENGTWESFSKHYGLASDSIGYIIGDNQGYLWVGSNRGLMRIQKTALVQSGGTNSFFCRVYGQDDGLPTRECSCGSEPAAIQARDGELLFPTSAGLVSINPAAIKPDLRRPRILIESARVNGQEQNTNPLNSAWSPVITIPPGGGQLEIRYTALNFSAPQDVDFKYQLEGVDSGWIDAHNFREARYPELSPGHYRFHVIACNEDGFWDHTGCLMDIMVLPQFWQTKTFQVAVILLALLIIVGIVRYVSTQKLQRELLALKQKEALEGERARIARDLHDQLGANLTQVALLGEMAEADKHLPEEVESHTRQISQTARETTRALDEIVWAVNPSNDTLEGLANYACKYASEYLALANLPCRMDVPPQLPVATIPPEVRHNVFLAFKEAVHNVVKHAQAREVWIRLRLQPKRFVFQIQDNGRGVGGQQPSNRNGLRNMKKRMTDIGGDFTISSGSSGGTLVELSAPLHH